MPFSDGRVQCRLSHRDHRADSDRGRGAGQLASRSGPRRRCASSQFINACVDPRASASIRGGGAGGTSGVVPTRRSLDGSAPITEGASSRGQGSSPPLASATPAANLGFADRTTPPRPPLRPPPRPPPRPSKQDQTPRVPASPELRPPRPRPPATMPLPRDMTELATDSEPLSSPSSSRHHFSSAARTRVGSLPMKK